MAFEWTTTPEAAFGALFDSYVASIHQLVKAICLRREPEIQAWMQVNAPWTDRTGNARQTLWVKVEDAITEIIVIVSHGVDYGYWLEVKSAGAYSVLTPAIDHWLPIIMADIQEQLRP